MARITLWGMMQYDGDLFGNIVLPDGIEKDILVSEIVQRSGDLYPYYQVPPILKQNIEYWFIRRRYDFEQMYKALTAQYNPIENYDRYEDTNRKYENSGSDVTENTVSNTLGSKIERQTDSTSTESVSAYNASDFTNRNKNDLGSLDTTTNSGTDTSSGNNTITYGAKRAEDETSHIHGNIGVTTAQQMIESENEMRMKYDLYSMIASLFEKEFIVQLY